MKRSCEEKGSEVGKEREGRQVNLASHMIYLPGERESGGDLCVNVGVFVQ